MCNYFKQHLNLGDTGGEVKKLQDFLNQYMHAGLVVDGIYGKMTKQAVKNFQTLHFNDTITPWVTPVSKFSSRVTGRFYKTTMATANIIIGCPVDQEYLEDTKATHSFGETSRRLLNSFKGFVRGLWQ